MDSTPKISFNILRSISTLTSQGTEAFKAKVRIEQTSFGTVEAQGIIPTDMWDGKSQAAFPRLHNGTFEVVRLNNKIDLDTWYQKEGSTPKVESVKVLKVDHEGYRAKHDEKDFLILIPSVYANSRPNATREMLSALEEGLEIIPNNLFGLSLPTVQFHLGKPLGIFEDDRNIRFEDKSFSISDGHINIHHGAFNGPATSLDEREQLIIGRLRPQNILFSLGQDRIAQSVLPHEIGHLLNKHIVEVFQGEKIYFPNGKEIAINNSLAQSLDKNGWSDDSDPWVHIVREDGNITSNYGNLSPNEDFAEATNGFINYGDTFRRFFPNRSAFLDYFIPRIKT